MAPKSAFELALRLRNDLSEIDSLCGQIRKFGAALKLSKRHVAEINLAVEELFNNIVSYGYRDRKAHWIDITLSYHSGEIVVRIEDDGVPFDPSAYASPDRDCRLEDSRVGGLGIHLVRSFMDQIIYSRCRRKNVTLLKKRLGRC